VTDTVTFQAQGAVGIITLNRPDKLNAVTTPMLARLTEILDTMQDEVDIRVLVLTGAGRGFCAGADVGRLAVAATDAGGAAPWRPPVEGRDICLLMRTCDKPIIGAINGAAVGWGLGLALATDIRIASDQARFGAAWTHRGLMADGGGTYFLPRALGTARAAEMLFTGAMYDAHEAERLGLVNRVVPHDQLMPATLDLAQRIAAMPPLAVALNKRALYRATEVTLAEAMLYEHAYQQHLRRTEDHREGVQAFVEKREPKFTGR
jgi:2-(1,2-epoxy-1,2-dihydrophenyl)acetyl-CoA isomerase